jgi:hypothetical protein
MEINLCNHSAILKKMLTHENNMAGKKLIE